jgi:hypothetical protein
MECGVTGVSGHSVRQLAMPEIRRNVVSATIRRQSLEEKIVMEATLKQRTVIFETAVKVQNFCILWTHSQFIIFLGRFLVSLGTSMFIAGP